MREAEIDPETTLLEISLSQEKDLEIDQERGQEAEDAVTMIQSLSLRSTLPNFTREQEKRISERLSQSSEKSRNSLLNTLMPLSTLRIMKLL